MWLNFGCSSCSRRMQRCGRSATLSGAFGLHPPSLATPGESVHLYDGAVAVRSLTIRLRCMGSINQGGCGMHAAGRAGAALNLNALIYTNLPLTLPPDSLR